jgi:ribosomal protein S18 acetylase RimI-like enzyme
VIIREISLSDVEEFLDLCKTVDESNVMLYEPGERKTTAEQQKKMIKRVLSEENSTILVAELDGKLVGYMCAFGGGVKRNRHSAYLVLGVLGGYQGKGIATKLFEQLFIWAKITRISRLELTVIKTNLKAFNLYRKMGFVIEGEKVHSLVIDGVPTNEYYLYRLV